MNITTLLKTATALPLVAMLALAGCGGGGSEDRQTSIIRPDPPIVRPGPPIGPDPLTLDKARRTRILEGNDMIIEAAVDKNIKEKDTGWRDVSYDWDGSDLRFTIHEDGVSSPPVVSLSSTNDAVRMFDSSDPETSDILSALSGTNIQSRTRREFQIGQSIGTRDTIGRIGVDYRSDADYFVYGYWLTVNHGQGDAESVTVDTGAFSSAFGASTNVPSTIIGEATYRGIRQASGLHTVTYSGETDDQGRSFSGGTGEFRIAHFVGDVMLTANFTDGVIGDDSININSKIDNIYYPDPEEDSKGRVFYPDGSTTGGFRAFEVKLGEAEIDLSGYFTGSATTVAGPEWSSKRPGFVSTKGKGYWEGQFSSRPVSQSNSEPRAVAGTFATTYEFSEGTVGKYVGTFSAGHCSSPSC